MTNLHPLTAIIVDDSVQARELLSLMINELAPHVKILGQAENVNLALELIKRVTPELIFLDINMPGKSGLELFEMLIQEQITSVEVIFTTAYNQYAVQAFRLSAIDYLLKPINEKELVDAIQKAGHQKKLKLDSGKFHALLNNLKQNNAGTLTIPVNYGNEFLSIESIEFIEADRAYSIIHLMDGTKKLTSKPMGYFEEALQHLNHFLKTHRSYLVNAINIKSFTKKNEGGIITFKSGKSAEVSRNQRKLVIQQIELLKG